MDDEETASDTLSFPYRHCTEEGSGSLETSGSKDNTLSLNYSNTEVESNFTLTTVFSIKEQEEEVKTNEESKSEPNDRSGGIDDNLEWVDFESFIIFDDATEDGDDEDEMDVIAPLPVTSKKDIEANTEDSTVLDWLFSEEQDDDADTATGGDANSVWMHGRLGKKSDLSLLGEDTVRDDISQITCYFDNPKLEKQRDKKSDSKTSDTSPNQHSRHRKSSPSICWSPSWIKCIILVLFMVFVISVLVLGVALFLQDYNKRTNDTSQAAADDSLFLSSSSGDTSSIIYPQPSKGPPPLSPIVSSITKDNTYSPMFISVSTSQPSYKPTTMSPSITPTYFPTISPSNLPTSSPTTLPSTSSSPTRPPSLTPTVVPTTYPTISPSTRPTNPPSNSYLPSLPPTATPTVTPTTSPMPSTRQQAMQQVQPIILAILRPLPTTNQPSSFSPSPTSEKDIENNNEFGNFPSGAEEPDEISPTTIAPVVLSPVIDDPEELIILTNAPIMSPVLVDDPDNSKVPSCIPAEEINDRVFEHKNSNCRRNGDCGVDVQCLVFNNKFASCDPNYFFGRHYPSICPAAP